MDKNQIKSLLEAVAEHTTDASVKNQVNNFLKQIESSDGKGQESGADQVSKDVLKKIVDYVGRFLVKLAEYKAVRAIWEVLENLDMTDP